MKNIILSQGKEIQEKLVEYYRHLHSNAEVGFQLPETVAYVKKVLDSIGCQYEDCGKSGVVAVLGQGENDASFLLRCDMDALPIAEKTELEYACKTGNMHACGHDMHTAILLGAATILKKNESSLKGRIKLMFQPAEEILCGALNMIENGVLENPVVKGALMLHALSGVEIPTGSFIVSGEGVSAPAADFFTINIQGKSAHGSTPFKGIDPITAGAHMVIALQEIQAREVSADEGFAMSIGSFNGGVAGNVIAEGVSMQGSLRAFDDNARERIKKRVTEICENIGNAFRVKVSVDFTSGCPTLVNDKVLSSNAEKYLEELFSKESVFNTNEFEGGREKGGSEDFAYISHKVPSLMIGFSAGELSKGYTHPGHHPKVKFDESVLWCGSVAMAYLGAKFIEDINENTL